MQSFSNELHIVSVLWLRIVAPYCGSVPLCALPASSILPLCRTPATVRSTPPTGLTGPLWCWAVVWCGGWCGGWCGIHWWTGGPRRWLLRTFVARHRSVLPTRTTCLCRKKGEGYGRGGRGRRERERKGTRKTRISQPPNPPTPPLWTYPTAA